jgi:hypothetical protein
MAGGDGDVDLALLDDTTPPRLSVAVHRRVLGCG